MLANFYGHKVSQDDIAGAIYLPEIRGTLTTELADYARHFRFWVRSYRGSTSDLRQKLTAGIPLIVLGKISTQYHYFIVLAIDDFRGTLTVHSDTRPFLELRQESFERFWDRADRWTLLICPVNRVHWKLSAEEHNDLGVYSERAGQWAAAEQHYRAAVALRHDSSYFYMNLGNVLLKQRRLPEAVDAFARAVAIDPQNADALNNLACVYLDLGENLDKAVHLSRKAALIRPSHRAYYLDTLGSVLLKLGRPKDAVGTFEEALAATTDRQTSLRTSIEQRLAAARVQAR